MSRMATREGRWCSPQLQGAGRHWLGRAANCPGRASQLQGAGRHWLSRTAHRAKAVVLFTAAGDREAMATPGGGMSEDRGGEAVDDQDVEWDVARGVGRHWLLVCDSWLAPDLDVDGGGQGEGHQVTAMAPVGHSSSDTSPLQFLGVVADGLDLCNSWEL